MTDTVYVNKPGGVIVNLKDGSSAHLAYGKQVPVGDLASYENAAGWSDETPRIAQLSAELEQEAHRRAALAEGGQVNSGSSSVPGNYNELDEDGAAVLVAGLARYPEQQASVIEHEILFGGGRVKVLDAATEFAKGAAYARLAQRVPALAKQGFGSENPLSKPFTGFGDPTRSPGDDTVTEQFAARADAQADEMYDVAQKALAEHGIDINSIRLPGRSDEKLDLAGRHGSASKDGGEAAGWDPDKVTHDQITAYAEQHQLSIPPEEDAGGKHTKAERVDAIKQYEGHESPQTPPQES